MQNQLVTWRSRVNSAHKKPFVALAIFIALIAQLFAPISSAQAALSSVTALCRSTTGNGATLETSALYNGYYQTNGIKIVPVYSKRMYVDTRNNFNATYIGYKVTNVSGATINNLVVELTGFTGGAVTPATANDTFFRIGTLANSESKTAYFFVKASGASAADQRHDVRVSTDDGVTKTEKATCYTNIQAVQRSLAASANKVTSITTSTNTPAMGGTVTVTVLGTPGKVGSGELPDNSIIAMSPASYASWPTKALRLESVELTLKGLTGSYATNCGETTIDTSGGAADLANTSTSGSVKSFTIKERLVIRNAGNCLTSTKQSYETKYIFRIVGSSSANPVIVPLASISSGTQIKYTGTLPATQTSVNLTATTYPVTVQKTFVSSVVNGSNVDLTYRITASGASGSLDELRDDPQSGFTFVSATFTDERTLSATAITPTNIGTTADPLFRFAGPFSVTTARSLILNYVVRVAIPSSNSSFSNYGYGMVAGVEIGNQTTVSGINADITTTGGVTTTSLTAKEPQVISFTATPTMGVDAQQTLSGYSDSGLPVSYTSLTPSTCVVSELNGVWTLTAIGEGACQIKASQAGNDSFDPATDVIVNVTVLKGQVITPTKTAFSAGPSGTATVTVYSTSTYLVTLVSVDTSICTVNSSPVVSSTGNKQAVYTITQVGSATGTCVLTASQAGDTGANRVWGPAPDVDVLIGIGSAQNLAFTSPAANTSYNYSTSTNITVVVSSYVGSTQTTKTGLPVALRSATPSVCTLITTIATDGTIDSGYNSTSKDTTLSFKMVAAGTCTVIASQDGFDDAGAQSIYAMANEVSRSFTIVASGSTAQTLTFDSIATKTYGDPSFPVYVSSLNPSNADTTLLVTISSTTPDVCIVGSSTRSAPKSTATLYMLSGGTCGLKGTQAGNTDYAAATTTTSFTVNKKQLTISGLSIPSRQYNGTKTSTLSGTTGLDGVVPGDTASDIDHSGTPVSADFSSAAAGTTESLAVTGITTVGTKKDSSYTLVPLSLTGSITERQVTYRFNPLSIGPTDSTTCAANVSLSSGTLVAGETLDSIGCDPATLTGSNLGTGVWPVTPQNAVIKNGSTITSGNYSVTYLAGDLTVEAVAVPTVSADELTVYYGELTDSALGSVALTSAAGSGVRAISRSAYVAGSVSHSIGGNSVPVDLPVGDHTVDVSFTPTNSGAYGSNTTQRVVHVLPRHITYQVAQVDDKEYDGNTDATVSGTRSLIAQPGLDGKGVLTGDEVDLELVGTQTATFSSASVGASKSVTLGGLTLSGAKSANYVLHEPATTTASITQRHITVSFNAGSLAPGESTTCISQVSVTSGSLVTGETLDAIDCTPATLSEAALGAGSWLVTPSNGVIKAGSVAKTTNYLITYVAHHLSVTSLVVPDLETDELTVYYGDLTATQLGSTAQTSGSGNGVRAKDGSTFVPGAISHSYNGAAIPEDLPVGDYTVDVNFTPSSPGTYTGKSGHRVIHVLKRHLTYVPGTIADKEYDGNTNAVISGSGSLIAQPGADELGVLAGDTADLSLTGTQTGVFADANVGDSKSVTVTGLSLTGSKRNNYELHQPATRTANITQRHITLSFGAISIGPGESTTCLPNIVLTSGTFVSGEVLSSISCSPSTLSSDALGVGSWRVDPSNAVIKAGATDKTSNYLITYVGHDLTVSALDVPDIDADPITVYYGELTAAEFGSSTQDNGLSQGVRAKHGPNYVAGSISHRYNGAAIPEDLPVGDYLVDVEFTPTNPSAYASNNGHRVVHVLPRHLTYSFGTVADKEYDGTTDAVITGSNSLRAAPGRDGLGVLAADAGDLELTGTIEAAFASASVGDSKTVNVTGLALGGTKRSNYVLHQPSVATAKITKRDAHLTIPVLDKDYDGTTSGQLDCDNATLSGLVANDIPDIDLSCGYTSATFDEANAGVRTVSYVGSAPTLVDKPTKSKAVNYRVVVSSVVATIRKITPTITIGAITAPQAGQRISVLARSNMSHKPVVITVTSDPVGACEISGTSITTFAEGTCTVEASQESDTNHNSGSNFTTFSILAASVTPSPSPSPSTSVSPSPTPSATPSVSPSNRPVVPSPTPIPLTSATPTPTATPSPTSSPSPTATPRPAAPAVPTINAILEEVAKIIEKIVGPNVLIPDPNAAIEGKADLIIDGKPAAISVAVKTLDEAAEYRNAGYQGGTGSRIEVIGARTTGQFVVAPGGAFDVVAIAAAIEESTARNATNFARIDSVVNVTPPAPKDVYAVDIDENHKRIFAASGLKEPVSLASLDTSKSTKWVSVEASADTYLPGSRVYLTVTTDPIVFAEAVVDKYGKAQIQGDLPIDLLEAGGHSIRVVGVRSLEGVTTRDDGSITLTQSALDEIQRFDEATMATVLISGETRAGGNRTSVLEIPLDRQVSWWALWLAIATSLLALGLRLIKGPAGGRRKFTALVLALVGGIPAAVLGWIEISYELWIGAAVSALVSVFLILFSRRARARRRK